MLLDTLEILIEADATGLTTQLNRASDNILGFVNKMNAQEVDWTSILSKTISPAIITGIAATFAEAIISATTFQNSMVTASENSQNAFGQNAGALSDSVLGISDATGQAAGDVAQNLGKLIQLFGNDTPTALAAMQGASQLATITGMSLGDVVNLLIPIFDNWGINTVPGVTSAIDDLFEASKTGKIGFGDLAQAAADSGVALRDKTNIKDTVFQLEQMSNQAGMTAQGTLNSFKQITTGLQDPLSNLSILSGGFSKLSSDINAEGIVGAFADVKKVVGDTGSAVGATLGKQMGLTLDSINQIQALAPGAFKAVADGAKEAEANEKSLNDEMDQSMTLTKELGILWNVIFNALGKLNLDIGTFIQKLAGANSLGQITDLLAGNLQYQTTPAVAPGQQTYPGFSANGPTVGGAFGGTAVPGYANGNNSTSSTNTNFQNIFNITSPAGAGGMTADSISKTLFNQFQGIQ